MILADAETVDTLKNGVIGALIVLIPTLLAWVDKRRANAIAEWQKVVERLDTDLQATGKRIITLEKAANDCNESKGKLDVTILKQSYEIRELIKDMRRVQAKTGDLSPGTVLPVVVTATADDGIIRDVGPQIGAMFHWTRKELVGQSLDVLMADENKKLYTEQLAEIASGAKEADPSIAIHGFAVRQDGVKFPVVIHLTSWRSPQTSRVFVNAEIKLDDIATSYEVEKNDSGSVH
jgi:PAS domain S-box-containing protein